MRAENSKALASDGAAAGFAASERGTFPHTTRETSWTCGLIATRVFRSKPLQTEGFAFKQKLGDLLKVRDSAYG